MFFQSVRDRVCNMVGHSYLMLKDDGTFVTLSCCRCQRPVIVNPEQIRAITRDLAECLKTEFPELRNV
jgi:hypothetical protein